MLVVVGVVEAEEEPRSLRMVVVVETDGADVASDTSDVDN